MKRFILGFSAGIATLLLVGAAYIGYLLKVASPGYRMSENAPVYSKEQTSEIVSALLTLSEVSNLLGLDRYTALFGGSAGIIGNKAGMSTVQAKYALLRAMSLSLRYGKQTGDLDPFLESSFSMALHLSDQSETRDAKKVVEEALLLAKQSAPNSYWISNLERLNKHL